MVIAKNIISSYLSKAWFGVITFLSIPYILRRLGPDAYAVLSLSLIILGYSVLLDFGLGRGVVKYMAEYNVLGDKEAARKLMRSSFVLYLVMGVLGAALLASFTRLFVNRVFKIPMELHHDASIVFYLTACGLALRLPQSLFQSVYLGYQKISQLNLINAIFNSLKVLVTVLLLYMGYFLVAVGAALFSIEVVRVLFLYWSAKDMLPSKGIGFGLDLDIIRKVFAYSFKAFTADSLGMLTTYTDKIIIGILLPIANLTFYVVPFDLACRIWEFQVAAVSATFPAFSEYSAAGSKEKVAQLYMKITKAVVIISAFLASMIFVFANEILIYWISPDFALKGQFILRVFSWGILTSSILSVVGIASYGINRLEIPLKINSIMVLLHICLCVILIGFFQIKGAALSWIITHLLGIYLMVPKLNKAITGVNNAQYLLGIIKPIVLSITVSGLLFFLCRSYIHGLVSLIVTISSGFIFYAVLAYLLLLSSDERSYILSAARQFIPLRP